MIRTSKHSLGFMNTGKGILLLSFIEEYGRCLRFYVDYIWNTEIRYEVNRKGSDNKETKIFNVSTELYECPRMLSTVGINFETTLSGRALKCCMGQALGVVRAVLDKPKSYSYILEKLKKEGKDYSKVESRMKKLKITKPEISKVRAELNSICCDFVGTSGEFDGFLQLKCIGKDFGKIRIPIKFHRQSNTWKSKGKMMTSFLISDDFIEIRWESEKVEKKKEGSVLGADQGYKTVLTLSDGTMTPKSDSHGHTLESIQKRLSGKRKGSKSFRKSQEHRKNFINWEINQLNFNGVKQINLEKVVNIRHGRKSSRLMSHWTNTLIRDKLLRRCEESGVQVILQSSTYRSQRCFSCGWVQKRNRKSGSKDFLCKQCHYQSDADLNAAKNHSIKLPDVPISLSRLKLNRKGFYWNSNGFKSLTGEDFTVPLSQNKKGL